MSGLTIVIVTSLLGVDIGYQTADDGGMECVIQIEPELLDALREGRDVTSAIDPQRLSHLRRFRVVVGDVDLPQALPKGEPPQLHAATGPQKTEVLRPVTPEMSPKQSAGAVNQASSKKKDDPADTFPFRLALFGMFGSIGANLFLGWVIWGQRIRYRRLLYRRERSEDE